MKMSGSIRSLAFLFFPFLVFGEVIEVDVGEWADVSNGVTSAGWTVSGIDRYADGGAKFTRASDSAVSPPYADIVTQIVMSVKSSSPTVVKKLMITPMKPEDATVHEARPTASSDKYETESFSWIASEGVRQFCLQESGGGSGNWGVKSLAVYTDRIEPPTGLREDSLYRDAFAAAWDPAPRAVRYDVKYASVTRIQPSYETVVEWDFSSLTNTHGGNPRTLDLLKRDYPGKLDDLTGMNVCMEKYTGGHIQIGQKEKLGLLGFPIPSISECSGPLTGILQAWKHPDDSTCPTLPIYWAADGVTNDLATFELTVDKKEYRFPIPEGVAIESVILSSTTNLMIQKESHGRVRVESFALVSGYDPGSVTTNEFKILKSRATEKVVKGLAPGEWLWAVRSLDADGRDSSWSPYRAVILDPKSRSYPCPGFGVSIR